MHVQIYILNIYFCAKRKIWIRCLKTAHINFIILTSIYCIITTSRMKNLHKLLSWMTAVKCLLKAGVTRPWTKPCWILYPQNSIDLWKLVVPVVCMWIVKRLSKVWVCTYKESRPTAQCHYWAMTFDMPGSIYGKFKSDWLHCVSAPYPNMGFTEVCTACFTLEYSPDVI